MENKKIALFIDADNAPAKKIDVVLSELAKYGLVTIRRAYGNWKSPTLKGWEEALHEFSIQPVQQFDLTKGKNAADIALVIDVMDTIYIRDIDVICIISSDCDFTPLATRVVADGKVLIGFGERKTPKPFTNACSRFLFLDDEPEKDSDGNKTLPNLKGDTRLISLLRQAVEAFEDDDGWAKLSPVGTHISNHASFDQRNYGFKKLSDLFLAIDLFEVKKFKGNYLVRDKRKSK